MPNSEPQSSIPSSFIFPYSARTSSPFCSSTMRSTTAPLLLCLVLPGLANPVEVDFPKGLSQSEIVKRMAALPAPDPALHPDAVVLAEREIDELDWSVWEPGSVTSAPQEPVPDPDNPHEFDFLPEGMEWDEDQPEPEWSIKEGSDDDDYSWREIALCNEKVLFFPSLAVVRTSANIFAEPRIAKLCMALMALKCSSLTAWDPCRSGGTPRCCRSCLKKSAARCWAKATVRKRKSRTMRN